MKTIILSLAVLAITSGCGKGVGGPTDIAPEFRAYAEAFNQEAAAQGSPARAEGISIRFGDLSSGAEVRGSCTGHDIVIDKQRWEEAVEVEREEIVFHELGHCVLGRGHDQEMDWDAVNGSVAASLMNATLPGISAYESRRGEYMQDLFRTK